MRAQSESEYLNTCISLQGIIVYIFRTSNFCLSAILLLQIVKKKRNVERFSFQCQKETGFTSTTLYDSPDVCDWSKKLVRLFHPIRSKDTTNHNSFACVFHLGQLHVITLSFDWFTLLAMSFVIGWSNYCGRFGFMTLD